MAQSSASSIPTVTTALLLAQSEDFAVIDRRALREAGIGQTRVLTSGVYAARFLAGKEKGDRGAMPDIVLAHRQLADMSGADFVEIARSHPRLAGMPILCISSSEAPEEKIKALAQGYSGLLVRPYSGESMREALDYAASVRRDRDDLGLGRALLNTELFDKALERFETMLGSGEEEPEKAFYSGLEDLRQRRWDDAIRAFQRALKLLSCKGEAEYGLALAWKGKGDQKQYKLYLERAGHSFAQAAKWHRVRVAYARLLQEAPRSESPFLLEAERLIRAGRFEEAATALAEGHDLVPRASVPGRLARTLLYNSDAPEEDAEALGRSLRGKSPEVAEQISEELREEMDGRKKRVRERAKSAPTASSSLFAQGIPPLGEEPAAEAAPRAQSASPAIEPLSEQSVMSDLFSDRPGMNEAVTVAKLTWKIFRSGRL